MIAAIVYLLCALTSTLCAVLLYLNSRKNKTRMVFWSSLCFFGLALNNMLLFVDRVLTTSQTDLSIIRTIPALVGYALIIWGFIWDT